RAPFIMWLFFEPGLSPGEIIGGWEAKPHSRSYMAHLAIQCKKKTYICGGFLVSEKFVLMAGDSGGPLVCGKTAQSVVTWGPVNGSPPRVYAKVSTFIPWIQAMMRRLQP
uniref:Peptidase S1 domain-containing protein n=1 Tax=Gopherus agassizii TaxID=38772 RepID=A0A452IJA2_9SAUR